MKYTVKYLLPVLFILTATINAYSQKTVFAQDCPYKNNPFSKKIMGAYIVEDTVLDEKLIPNWRKCSLPKSLINKRKDYGITSRYASGQVLPF